MADDGKPAHYSEKYKAEIADLKAEVERLKTALEAASTSTVVGPLDVVTADMVEQAKRFRAKYEAMGATVVPSAGASDRVLHAMVFGAMFVAANEARNMGVDSLLPLMKDRWHALREFGEYIASGQDVKDYEARQAKIQAETERQERQKRLDEEGEKRKKAAAVARSRGEAPADVSLGVVLQ